MTAGPSDELIRPLLKDILPRPVLVDIGASAEVPRVWRTLASHSIYVGFDPDLREMREENGAQFHKAFVLNQAVTPDATADCVTFHLTRHPQCSSTLLPNRAVVDNYLFPERFDVERQARVAATTLNAALGRLNLNRIDWLKLDTQGTDQRLFESLSEKLQSSLLAVDAEPGLRGAYDGEDHFGDLHKVMVGNGFWCTAAMVKGLPRVRQATLTALADGFGDTRGGIGWGTGAAACHLLSRVLPYAPGWVECRYLRTVEWLAANSADQRSHILLWAFAVAADQPGFAADVAAHYGQQFGPDENWRSMVAATVHRMRHLWTEHCTREARKRGLLPIIRRRLKRLATKLGSVKPWAVARGVASNRLA